MVHTAWLSTTPPIRPRSHLVSQVFAHELLHPGQTARLAATSGESLVAAGYHAQVTPHDGAISLFHLNDGRESMRYAGDSAVDRRARDGAVGARGGSRTNARNISAPTCCCAQSSRTRCFPTICYVAGPNELAYLGQLRDVYRHFDVPMPLMYQRATATIVDSATPPLPFQVLAATRSAATPGRVRAQSTAAGPAAAEQSTKR